jgi:lipoprotein NlpD
VRWNVLDNPNTLEVGQVLRIAPPAPVVVADTTATGVVVRPIPSSTLTTGTGTPTAVAPSQMATGTASAATAPSTAPVNDEELAWIWPVPGSVLAGYDEAKNKGIDIGGKAGDSVLASADGRVVYAGSGLRGYGNLIILKHNNTYLTAYAHNQALLVKEDQAVRKGQKIAEMGNSDADRIKLHFEVRRQGKPVDPAKYLPPR